jgi:hypothetical protein
MKSIRGTLPLIALSILLPAIHAQNAIEAYVGLGTAFDKAAPGGIDSNSGAACTVASSASSCLATPALGGVFMNLGGAIMFNHLIGAGAEFAVQPAKADYGPLQFRQSFVDVNGIYAPITNKRYGVQVQGGIGSARTSFSYTQSSCVGTAVCTNQSQSLGVTNHFQVHAGVGLQILLTEHLFVRPQFDYHYVPNFTQQFGSNSVPMVMFTVGYTSGRGN